MGSIPRQSKEIKLRAPESYPNRKDVNGSVPIIYTSRLSTVLEEYSELHRYLDALVTVQKLTTDKIIVNWLQSKYIQNGYNTVKKL